MEKHKLQRINELAHKSKSEGLTSDEKEEVVNSDQIACFILKTLYELYPEKLKDRYDIDKLDDDYIEAYELIGKKRGALSRGGIVDYEKVSNIIVRDLKNGYFGNITLDRLDDYE